MTTAYTMPVSSSGCLKKQRDKAETNAGRTDDSFRRYCYSKAMTMIFRRAEESDPAAIGAMYEAAAEKVDAWRLTGWVKGVYPVYETALEAYKRGDLFVASDQGEIVASAVINHFQHEAYSLADWKYPAPDEEVMVLHTLMVNPEYTGRGYGSRFVKFYEAYAGMSGCRILRLDTQAVNVPARNMYRKLGYREAGIVACEFCGIHDVRLVLLEKKAENTGMFRCFQAKR